MKITIECDCGEKFDVEPSELYVRDTTPCNCGCCSGEQYEVSFGNCPKCKTDIEVTT